MKNVKMTILMVMAVWIMAAGQGLGWTQYKDGGIHNINSTVNDDVWVDYQTSGMQTTVNLLNGGRIPTNYKLQAYNNSRINISGGSEDEDVLGNAVWDLRARDSSSVTISGGYTQTLYAYDNSQITIVPDGGIGSFDAYNSSRVTISGGEVYSLNVRDNSQATMSGGQLRSILSVYGGQVIISDGIVNRLDVWNGKVKVSGGTIGGLTLDNNANLILDGSNFAIDGSTVGFGNINSILGGNYNNDPYRLLTGTLANGDRINTQFWIGKSASITLIPEPATLLLFGLGGLVARRFRK